MIRRYRRFWALPGMLLLCLPLIVLLLGPGGAAISEEERRTLAQMPPWPTDAAEWQALPDRLGAYLRDHFGLRRAAIHAHALLQQDVLRSGNAQVLTGSDGWLFFRGDDMILQSAGLALNPDRVAQTADLIRGLHDALAGAGTALLVAFPPNASTIYPEALPRWARNPGRATEYDLMLQALSARGVTAVDLRPALLAAKGGEALYHRHDTHWTARGAVIGFNAIARAAGHADWQLDPDAVLGPPIARPGGDLARMLGIAADVTEPDRDLALPGGQQQQFGPEPYGTYVATADHPGPTILVIGDSFTRELLAPMLLQHAGRVIWVHHQWCGFDRRWMELAHPDVVWWMPTERYLVCRAGLS